ncbi:MULTISPECIES: ABC transporter permease subunit [Sulfitobacter]|uniref:ABC transporter permease n=1 Tax=Sulfitobacter profundi TaxID=2679961 RepID=A0ABW1Z5A4_9RHOB|nr:ABC transporter permease [Sulfitobacter indolifex]|tara:strand:- start:34466 stop:35476 length:1011 start_codon:yes stop_codon:yes gene_type:complete
MQRLILKRLGLMVVMLLGLAVITFTVANIAPGDPARLAAGPDASPDMVEKIRVERGFDRALPVRFGLYLGQLAQGDLGTSVYTGRPVAQDIAVFLPATIELVLFSILIAVVLGVPFGVLAAVWQNRLPDHAIRFLSVSGVALPMFWLGLMLQWYLSLELGLFPLGGRLGIFDDVPTTITGMISIDALLVGDPATAGTALMHMVLPATALSFPALAAIIRVNRAEMLEVLGRDYVVNARAQGIGPFRIIAIYALKNAILPTLAMIGLRFGWMLGGTVLVESVFDFPGIGLYAAKAAISSDFEPIMAVTLILGAAFMLTNLLIDLMYALLDPRVRNQI